jgi:hypothetical protein
MPRKKVEMEHPMAGKSRASKAQKLAEDSQDIFDKLDKQEAEKVAKAEEPVAPMKLKGLKELLFVGTLSKIVSIDGFVFKLRSLTHQESRAVAKRIFTLSDSEKLIESNAIQLAHSLESINGLSIDEAYAELFEDDGEEFSTVDKSLKIISNLNNHLTAKLINEYFELSNESKELLDPKDKEDLKK